MKVIASILAALVAGLVQAQDGRFHISFSNTPLELVLREYAAYADCRVEQVRGVDASITLASTRALSEGEMKELIAGELQKQNIGLFEIDPKRVVATWIDPSLAPSNSIRRLSYADRLHQRRLAEEARMKAMSSEPGLAPEELKKSLQQHQMDRIRRGEPSLPIPLTKEMDEQLVSEGVIPPDAGGPPGTIRFRESATNTAGK